MRGREEVSRALFSKLKKSALIFEKSTLIVFIYGLNFSLKMLFEEYLGKKSPKFYQWRLSVVCCRLNVYRSDLVLINLPCPKKFLVTRLNSTNFYQMSYFQNAVPYANCSFQQPARAFSI